MKALAEGPLRGLRALEIGHFVAAPAVGSLLAYFGAEVVKVEPPSGDASRVVAPWSLACFGPDKKSVCIDLKKQEGRAIFDRLVRSADILVENLAPGAVESLGIGYQAVSGLNRRIIYCSIKGFAGDSSKARRPAFDTVAQAEGGLMSTMGHEGQQPLRINNPCVDLGAAAYAYCAIATALLERERSGEGRFIEIALEDVALYWSSYWLAYLSYMGHPPPRLGSGHAAYSPYGLYEALGGYLFIGVITDEQWRELCGLLGIEPPPGLELMKERVRARELVDGLVGRAVKGRRAEEVVRLIGDRVPCGRVRDMEDIASDEELRRRGVVTEKYIDGKPMKVVRPPIRISGLTPIFHASPPPLGRDTREVLRSAGYREEEIQEFFRRGIVK